MKPTSINYGFIRRVLVLLLLLISNDIQATSIQTTPLILDSKALAASDISLSPYLELLEDPTRKLDIKQVSSAEYNSHFKPNRAEVPDFGRTESAWWARFQLHSTTVLERYLLIDQPIGGSVNVFVFPETEKAHLHRLENFRLPAYELQFSKNETVKLPPA